MKDKVQVTHLMAVIGTGFVGLPLLFMVVTSLIGSISSGRFLMDYFMPAELFPLVAIGAVLLFWAALRSRLYLKPILWIICVGLAALLGSQGIAMASGIGTGAREAVGIWFILLIIIYALYVIGVIALFVLGILFSRELAKTKAPRDITSN